MNLLKRVLIAIIFIPILLYIFYKGGLILLSFLALLSILMNFEFVKMLKKKQINIPLWTVVISPVLLYFITINRFDTAFFIIFIYSLIIAGKSIFSNRLQGSISIWAHSVLILLYTAIFPSYLFNIARIAHSGIFVVLLMVLIWITDTGAYFVGMTLGKHRGLISASPKKSIEGFIGGLFFAVIFGYVMTLFFEQINLKSAMFAALSAGIFGQFGDLVESMIKRDVQIKDSSNIIPGHGGILDRFDSLLIAAPAFYYLLKFFG